MILEIALGIVLGAILIYLLPVIFVLAMYALMFAIAVIFLALLGWGDTNSIISSFKISRLRLPCMMFQSFGLRHSQRDKTFSFSPCYQKSRSRPFWHLAPVR
ncbi:hypothetical protein [Roseovarius tolerans]|uniref:hypothetical protein n=1 Tax=Roseovarius tolerans TaxID=74031 RepID=UPI0009F4A87A|nr:hypothetical protein [Roseovarius tolerans]